jgi:hypothetical protein
MELSAPYTGVKLTRAFTSRNHVALTCLQSRSLRPKIVSEHLPSAARILALHGSRSRSHADPMRYTALICDDPVVNGELEYRRRRPRQRSVDDSVALFVGQRRLPAKGLSGKRAGFYLLLSFSTAFALSGCENGGADSAAADGITTPHTRFEQRPADELFEPLVQTLSATYSANDVVGQPLRKL